MFLENYAAENLLAAFFDESAYTTLFGEEQGAVITAYGFAGGQPAYAICQTGAALGAADVQQCCKTLDLAAKTGNPVVTFYHSKGAKLTEGLGALQAAAKLNEAAAKLSGVVPQIAVVTGICAASSALAAASADLCIVAQGSELFLSSPFLSAAAGDALPGAGSTEFAKQAGVAALEALSPLHAAQQAARLVALLPGNNLTAPASFTFEPADTILTPGRYTAAGAIESIADLNSAVVLYEEYGPEITTALGTVSGELVGFVATEAGKEITQHSATKAARFVRLCDSFSIPLVTLVNTNGFAQSSTEDVTGGIRVAARLAATYADATTAKVAVITGKAVGTAYLAFANADLKIALEGAEIAPVEPTAAVSILYHEEIEASGKPVDAETARLAAEYRQEVCSAKAAQKAGLAELCADPASLRGSIATALDILSSKRAQRMPKKHGNMSL